MGAVPIYYWYGVVVRERGAYRAQERRRTEYSIPECHVQGKEVAYWGWVWVEMIGLKRHKRATYRRARSQEAELLGGIGEVFM